MKEMPNSRYIHESEEKAPGFEAWKDRLTLVICCNAAGHMIKPGAYCAKNPRALKNKNKNILPVFWQHNLKAWVTTVLFTEWFHQCFIPEVKVYLKKEILPLKFSPILNNPPGHLQSVSIEVENVQVLSLSPNTTSLLQSLDQGIFSCVNSLYTRQVFEMFGADFDADPKLLVMHCWKSFRFADAITVIKAAMDELKPEKANPCWKNL